MSSTSVARWQHFAHEADVGVRGIGRTRDEAFEQAAMALTATVTDLDSVAKTDIVTLHCSAPDDELLLVDWLNAIVYEMATRKVLFGRFEAHIEDGVLRGRAWGEPVQVDKHRPAVEVKGATYTNLQVVQLEDGSWLAQCVIDV
jgi:tRNA nucleotidyltransferase (CCA-adding enzyme)